MSDDPIVDEVRKAGIKMAEDANGDVNQFFKNLKRMQKNYGKKLINKPVSKDKMPN